MKIGLFGFGTVAKGFYEMLNKAGLSSEIQKICIKDPHKPRNIDNRLFTSNADELLDDENINIIVELIDDSRAAKEIVVAALRSGKGVVSANKKMIAENLARLVEEERNAKGRLLYEGSVAASIPIIQCIDHYFSNQEIKSLRGILNGSSNYILTKMKTDGVSFDLALKEAQDFGFAESNPSLDIEGHDATFKTIILTYKLFNKLLHIEDVKRQGIEALSPYLQQQGRKEYSKLKLIADIRRTKEGLVAKVEPLIVHVSDALYPIDYEFNAVEIIGEYSDRQLLVGKGAGSYPTGFAVFNDYLKLRKR